MAQFTDVEKEKAVKKEAAQWPHPDAIAGREWGPFYSYQFITTEFGEYGLEMGRVLYFKMVETFNEKTKQQITAARPFYRDATEAEMEEAQKVWYESQYVQGLVTKEKMVELGYRKG